MCRNCVHGRAKIAGKLMLYHIDMMQVMGYMVLEGTMDEYINIQHPDIDEAERNRIVTDVAAAQGRAWCEDLSKELGDVLGRHVARAARQCERSIEHSAGDFAGAEDLDRLMQAREAMEHILTDVNVQSIIDDLTSDGQGEES